MFIYLNSNPKQKNCNDDSVRCLSKILEIDWQDAYYILAFVGCQLGEMPCSISTLNEVLKILGYQKRIIAKNSDYTVKDFCKENPDGIFVVVTGSHVVAVKDGNYFDNTDTGFEYPVMFWKK